MRTRKNNKSKKSNTIFRKARKNKIKQTGNGGVLSRLINGVDDRDNNICILYITTHGQIQNNDMRTIDQEEYSELDIKKINAVDMDVCNYINESQPIEIGNILKDYHTSEIMKREENGQDIDLETSVIQEILKQIDISHTDAKTFKRNVSVNGEKERKMVQMTPGISGTMTSASDQKYRAPDKLETDYMIVGRAVYNSENPVSVIKKYLGI